MWATVGGIILIQVVRFTIIGIKNRRLMQSGIREIDEMDGFQFEQYLALLFKKHGYNVKVTKSRSDFGADLILTKNGVKTVVQAKRYASNVGIKAIQEIIGAVKHYNADQSMVVTNSYYTKAAMELARTNNVELINRDQLVNMLLEVSTDNVEIDSDNNVPKTAAEPINEEVKIPDCPRCGTKMVLRRSRQGIEFFGCVNFPSCRQTKDIVL